MWGIGTYIEPWPNQTSAYSALQQCIIEPAFRIKLAAVRATHHFLSEADVQFYAGMVRYDYLPHAEFGAVVNASTLVAVMGMTGAIISLPYLRLRNNTAKGSVACLFNMPRT